MPSAAARLLYPAPRASRRPYAAGTRQQRRLCYRLARGATPAQAACAEQLPEAEVTALLATKDFQDLLAACHELARQPEAQVKARLVTLARFLIEEALFEGDLRAANFILYEDRRGRDGAVTLAEAALRQARTEPRPPMPSTPRGSRAPVCNVGTGEQRRTEARMGLALLHELGAEAGTVPVETAAEEPETAAEPAAPAAEPTAPAGERPDGRAGLRFVWRAWVGGRAAEPPAAKAQGP